MILRIFIVHYSVFIVYSITPLYLIVNTADRHSEEKKGTKYLTVVSAGRIKETLKKYTKLWDEIKYLIKTLNGGKSAEYGKDFMKNNFNFDLPFNKPLKFHAMTIIIRSVFEENGKYYPQALLGECLYEL